MVNNYKIGLNETQVGIAVPPWLIATMKDILGPRQTELALTSSKLFNTEEAFKIGLIDEVASDKEDCLKRSENFFHRLSKSNPTARVFTKQTLRNKNIQVSNIISYIKYGVEINRYDYV